MATIPELYIVPHWQYRAEGNANLVLQYTGPDPRFHTTVLRLRKSDRDFAVGSSTTTADAKPSPSLKKSDITQESLFSSKVIGLLLGQEFVEQLITITLPTEFLQELALAIESSRPEARKQKGIDFEQRVGFLALDHTRFIKDSRSHAPSIAVEIKPKWGFLTKSEFIRKDQEIKKRKCRFCMYQHQKKQKGQESHLSEYCPIDLFSGEESLVHYALDALVRTPQNNLRLFVEGTQKDISEDSMKSCLSVETEPSSNTVDLSTTLPDVLAQILVDSPLLKRLGRLQLGLDSLDIETVHQFYEQLIRSSASETIAQPTLEEFFTAAETFLERTDMDGMMNQDQESFEAQNMSSLGFQADDDLDDVPEEIKLHFIREYLLSATLKDCSVLITVRREDDADETGEISKVQGKSVTEAGDRIEFKELHHRVVVNDVAFVYKITCIDLDPKKMSTIPMQLRKDREIVNFYLQKVGDGEVSCDARLAPSRGSDPLCLLPFYLTTRKTNREQNKPPLLHNTHLHTVAMYALAVAVLNLLSLLVGMILLCVGTFVYFAPGAVFVTSTMLPHLVLVLGATITLVSFLGYYGVMNEKRWILWVHGFTLLIAIALQITVGAFAFAYRNQGGEVLDKAWDRVFRTDPRGIHDLESFFQCCGFEHVFDRAVPATCALDHHYMTGCREHIQTAFQDSLQSIGVIGAILGGIELVSLVGAAILFHRFDKQRYERERAEGETALVRALLEAEQVDRAIDRTRRDREAERRNHYQALADQVRAQTLARAQEEGLLGPAGSQRDPPPYGTFDSSSRPTTRSSK
ncbi:inositol-pentakisphosphate 2-kinase [Entomortierella parvispora]|uniref:Inositol-pentakisphosphate 2-kinase n=1 Tax=Entomortierella parvispora TaxID=205924 RepID=A0A9P3H2T8_9FUNG|nr:inositol-pentakisphosphate 2-kinase [Entomortierella parvispora]